MAAASSFEMIGRVELDADGFAPSFDLEQVEAWREFYDRWGVVVIRDVLTRQQCESTVEEIWSMIETPTSSMDVRSDTEHDKQGVQVLCKYLKRKLTLYQREHGNNEKNENDSNSNEKNVNDENTNDENDSNSNEVDSNLNDENENDSNSSEIDSDNEDDNDGYSIDGFTEDGVIRYRVSRRHPKTWASCAWPGMDGVGIVGGYFAAGQRAFENRQNERAYCVFRELVGHDELWTTVDRYGVMRPTVGHKDYCESWRTNEKWTHWDMNPWTNEWSLYGFSERYRSGRNGRYLPAARLQGLVALINCDEHDGGFYCVPGCCHHLDEWAEQHRDSEHATRFAGRSFVPLPRDDEALLPHAQKIPLRAGSLAVWSNKTVHSNFPNASNRFRMVQYVTMLSARDSLYEREYSMATPGFLPDDFEPSPLGLRLLGIESWSTDSSKRCHLC
jgi:hypothetical protein